MPSSPQDTKIIKELTKERPYLQFLAEKAVVVMDDTYLALKEQFTAPDPAEFRRAVKEGKCRRIDGRPCVTPTNAHPTGIWRHWRIDVQARRRRSGRVSWCWARGGVRTPSSTPSTPSSTRSSSSRPVSAAAMFGFAVHGHGLLMDASTLPKQHAGNYMLFTPMLAGSAVGTVEYSSITEVRCLAAHPCMPHPRTPLTIS